MNLSVYSCCCLQNFQITRASDECCFSKYPNYGRPSGHSWAYGHHIRLLHQKLPGHDHAITAVSDAGHCSKKLNKKEQLRKIQRETHKHRGSDMCHPANSPTRGNPSIKATSGYCDSAACEIVPTCSLPCLNVPSSCLPSACTKRPTP